MSACGNWACRDNALREGVSKGSYALFKWVSEKIIEKSIRLGQQARLGTEPGTSVLCTRLLRWIYKHSIIAMHCISYTSVEKEYDNFTLLINEIHINNIYYNNFQNPMQNYYVKCCLMIGKQTKIIRKSVHRLNVIVKKNF